MGRHRRIKNPPSLRWILFALVFVFVAAMVFVEVTRSNHEHQQQHKIVSLPTVQKRTLSETKPVSKISDEAPCPVGWRLEKDIEQCTRNAGGISNEMIDLTVDPCENPYRYACGRFIDDPRNQGENLLFYSLYQKNREIMQDIVLKHASERQGDVGLFSIHAQTLSNKAQQQTHPRLPTYTTKSIGSPTLQTFLA